MSQGVGGGGTNDNRSRRDFEDMITSKSVQDADFRERLLKDPIATLAGEIGLNVPVGCTVNVVEESPDQFFIVIPPKAQVTHEQSSVTGIVRLLAMEFAAY